MLEGCVSECCDPAFEPHPQRRRLSRPLVLLACGLWMVGLRADSTGLTWLWASPLPHGNNIYDLATRNGLTVEVGDRGRIYTSEDYDLWAPRESHVTTALMGVTFLGNRIVATGEAGTVVYADTGSLTNFAAVDLGTSDWLMGVTASARLAVAVGDNGAIYTSSDASVWTRRAQAFRANLLSVAFGSTTFVAVGAGGFLAVSTDGLTWTPRSSGTTQNLNRVVWIGNRFVAVGDGGVVLYSLAATGAGWSLLQRSNPPVKDLYAAAGFQNLLGNVLMVAGSGELRLLDTSQGAWANQMDAAKEFPAPDWTYYAGFWDGSQFLAAGRTGMLVDGFRTNATSGYVWLSPGDSIHQWLWDVAHWPGLYVAVGDLGTIQTSDSGADWSLEVVPASATNATLFGVGGRPDLLVVAGTDGTLLTSTDAVVWSAVSPKPTINDLQGVTWWGNQFVVTGGQGTILTSPDAAHWTARATGAGLFLASVAGFPGGVVAVGERGGVWTSADGAAWADHSLNTTNWLSRVRYLNGQLLVVGQNGTVFASPDGQRWTQAASGTSAWLNDVAWFGGRFYALGNQGAFLASADGVNWTTPGTITQKSLYAAAAEAHQLVTVGIEGLILRAQAGPLNLLTYDVVGNSSATLTNSLVLSGLPGSRFSVEAAEGGLASGWRSGPTNRFLDNSGQAVSVEITTNPPASQFRRARVQP